MYYLQRMIVVIRQLGFRAAMTYLFAERFDSSTAGKSGNPDLDLYQLHPKNAQFPVYCRRGSSDRPCFYQIFIEEEYQFLKGSPSPKLIVDCGANVGFSTVYFLSQFPEARVIAIEPDDRNLAMLKRNTAPYGDRVTILHSAVWSHPKTLVVSKGTYRDGREWATQVRECLDGEQSELQAIDIESLFEQYGFSEIDILKMDIERAELTVFSENYESWVGRVGIFVIELHDQECRDAFHHALGDEGFEYSTTGELTIAKRLPTA